LKKLLGFAGFWDSPEIWCFGALNVSNTTIAAEDYANNNGIQCIIFNKDF